VFCGLALSWSRVVAPVRGVDPDQVAAEGDDLILGGWAGGWRVAAGGGWVLGHHPMVSLAAGRAAGPWEMQGALRGVYRAGLCGILGVVCWRVDRAGGTFALFAGLARICYREAADPGGTVVWHTSGWRNWQTR
jgi:hypothetical protein